MPTDQHLTILVPSIEKSTLTYDKYPVKRETLSTPSLSGARFHPLWFFLILTGLLLSQACRPKMSTVEAPIEQPEVFSYSGTEVIPEEWWTSFNDSTLNSLVDTALTGNLDLAAVWEQFRASRALLRRESSLLWPEIDASLGAAFTEPQSDMYSGEDFIAGLSASYEVDLWGKIRSGIQAEEFRSKASYYDYQTTALILSAEISTTWYQLVTAKKQLALAQQQLQTNEDILRLIRARFTGGQIRAVDILRQQQLLESTRNQQIFYETEVVLLKNQLAVLLGKPPQQIPDFPQKDLPELPPLPDTGLPLELIRRRPDVQQAYHLVLAADREMAESIRNKYPRLSLNLDAQSVAQNSNNLFQDWAYSLAANLATPLLYGGRLQAEVDAAKAFKEQQLYQYGQTVLIAFKEVEDALIREVKQKELLEVLEKQLGLARKTNRQLQKEFLNGMSEYLDVLLSLDQEQQLQRDLLSAKMTLLEIRISLYRALAGGFETEKIRNHSFEPDPNESQEDNLNNG